MSKHQSLSLSLSLYQCSHCDSISPSELWDRATAMDYGHPFQPIDKAFQEMEMEMENDHVAYYFTCPSCFGECHTLDDEVVQVLVGERE